MRHPATLGKRPDDGAVDAEGVAIGAGVAVVMNTGAPPDGAALVPAPPEHAAQYARTDVTAKRRERERIA
jgi:hypothetical protein